MLFLYKNFTNVNENIKNWEGENESVEKDIMFCVNPKVTDKNKCDFTLSYTIQAEFNNPLINLISPYLKS
jgi:hypothetical protein